MLGIFCDWKIFCYFLGAKGHTLWKTELFSLMCLLSLLHILLDTLLKIGLLLILLWMVILLCFVYLYLGYSSQIIRQLCFLCLHKGCQRWLKNPICVAQVGIRSAESSTMNTGLLCFSNAFPYSLFLQFWIFIFTGDLQNTESNRVCVHCPATEPRSYMKTYTLLVFLGHHDEIVIASLGDLWHGSYPILLFLFSTCSCIFNVLICIKNSQVYATLEQISKWTQYSLALLASSLCSNLFILPSSTSVVWCFFPSIFSPLLPPPFSEYHFFKVLRVSQDTGSNR